MHGGQEQHGINFWDTFAPVVSWMSVRTLLVLSKIHNLHTKSIDFAQAYPQADIKVTIYLHTPQGVRFGDKHQDVVLQLRKNLYGLKDAGLTWWEMISKGLLDLGFEQTETDQCVFKKENVIILIYVDDCIINSRTKEGLDETMAAIKEHFTITDEGEIEEYLRIQIDREPGFLRMSQSNPINRIIEAIPGMNKENPKSIPLSPTLIMTKDLNGKTRQEYWSYRSLIGMMNYLMNTTHPELAYSIHQCARFCNDPKHSHEQAVKDIVRYLINTRINKEDKTKYHGLIFKIDPTKCVVCFVDASFAGDWNQSWSEEPSSVFSRTGYVIYFGGCPIIWYSKLQSEISLSTTEAEYVALSQSMRDTIPLMALIKELTEVLPIITEKAKVHCTVFEDNNSCIELVKCPRMRPRTKQIGLKYHHFRSACG